MAAGNSDHDKKEKQYEEFKFLLTQGKLEPVKEYLKKKGDDFKKEMFEHFQGEILISAFKNIDVLNFLVENGAKVDVDPNSLLLNPLIFAARKGAIEFMEFLLEKGANINAVNRYGETPLSCAAKWGETEAFKYLVKGGANLDNAAVNLVSVGEEQDKLSAGKQLLLIYAARGLDEQDVKFLIKNGASTKHVKDSAEEEVRDEHGLTILMNAAAWGKIGTMRYLIDEGHSSINQTDNNKNNPLMIFIENGAKKLFKLSPEERREFKSEIFSKEELDFIRYLLEKGGAGFVNSQNSDGKTALMIATKKGFSPGSEKVLIEFGEKLIDEAEKGHSFVERTEGGTKNSLGRN